MLECYQKALRLLLVKKKVDLTMWSSESRLIHFKWLVYSPSAKGGKCYVLFFAKDNSTRTKPSVLVATPFTNFREATGKDGIFTRSYSITKISAMMEGSEFKGCLNNPEQTVPFIISASNQSQYENNINGNWWHGQLLTQSCCAVSCKISVFVAIETLFLTTLWLYQIKGTFGLSFSSWLQMTPYCKLI